MGEHSLLSQTGYADAGDCGEAVRSRILSGNLLLPENGGENYDRKKVNDNTVIHRIYIDNDYKWHD